MDVEAAENVYFAKRKAMFDAGGTEQLQLAMDDMRGAPTAMRILRDLPVEATMDLFAPVFYWATNTHAYVDLSRGLLTRLDAGWLFHALRPLVKLRLDDPTADEEDYQRIAEVLQDLDQTFHLNELLDRAQQSTNPHILDVVEGFRPKP
ncbi:MAG: hypothetical protein ABI890_03625 [Lapillicoccus sp.]